MLSACAGASVAAPDDDRGPGGNDGAGGQPNTPDNEPTSPVFLRTRIRRLANAELDRAYADVLGTGARPSEGFAPDLRQSDFTLNASQRVDPVLASQLDAAARKLAIESRQNVLAGSSCARMSPGRDCAGTFIDDFVPRAFRRPIATVEREDLLKVFDAGASAGTFDEGIELVLTAVLQSASFVYVTELGDKVANGHTTMTDHEIAASLAFLTTGGPPDAELRRAAADGRLRDADERRRHAQRLLDTPAARDQLGRLVNEWLGIDQLGEITKDANVYRRFDELRPQMARETNEFVAEALFADDGRLQTLFGADYTVAESGLASFYGLSGQGRVPLQGSKRRGILNHASFLSVHGKMNESAPVERGVVVMEKVLCIDLPTPAELNLNVVPPDPDPNATTRQRFTQHADDDECRACHQRIDAIGFSFEGFDGMGGARTAENGKPIDSTATLSGFGDLDGPIADSASLAAKIADSAEMERCFARNLFRFASAQDALGPEKKYMEHHGKLDADTRATVQALLLAYIESELYVKRRQP
jgi:hypothetical protein